MKMFSFPAPPPIPHPIAATHCVLTLLNNDFMTKLSSQPELESIPEVTALNSILANIFYDFSILFCFLESILCVWLSSTKWKGSLVVTESLNCNGLSIWNYRQLCERFKWDTVSHWLTFVPKICYHDCYWLVTFVVTDHGCVSSHWWVIPTLVTLWLPQATKQEMPTWSVGNGYRLFLNNDVPWPFPS